MTLPIAASGDFYMETDMQTYVPSKMVDRLDPRTMEIVQFPTHSNPPLRIETHKNGVDVPVYGGYVSRIAKKTASDKDRQQRGRWYSGKR